MGPVLGGIGVFWNCLGDGGVELIPVVTRGMSRFLRVKKCRLRHREGWFGVFE